MAKLQVTPMQAKALPVLRWLLDTKESRGSGRTEALAIAYISLAIEKPGEWLEVRDHYPNNQADRYLMGRIMAVANKYFPKVGFEFMQYRFRRLL